MDFVAIAYLNAGRSYQLAATELMEIHTGAAFPDIPRRQCAMIAVELYLKSFLLHDGMDAVEVRELSHNVGRAAKLAVARGLEIDTQDLDLLEYISKDKTLLSDRYLVPGFRSVPDLPNFIALADLLYLQVGDRLREKHPDYLVGDKKMAPRRKGQ